ncbi:MAG TPA: T9SS type A sorting domain-containing protein [Rubricoccaceae bacterium]|nr:T9SS type A sorting domain-containing protein [Rubricoccaceae bacterium]
MRPLNRLLLLTALLLVGLGSRGAGAQVLEPGSCVQGTAERDLDINQVLARMFNTGSLFYGNTTTAGNGYLVPQASGHSPIFAAGIWIGGRVNGELRVAGATYDDFEYWPGPLGANGRPVNPSDCSGFDRIFKVGRTDIENYEGTGSASADLAQWPVEYGAPVIAAPDNGIDDDADGLTDEGTDGVDNDGDGFADERDEQERVTPEGRGVTDPVAQRDLLYNLANGDRPEIIGDQALFWIMNDVGNSHNNSGTPPLGLEVQVLAWSFARSDALGETTFYRYRVVNKGPADIEDTFLSIFSDSDLGDAVDDLVGVDTTLSLGFTYNAAETDAVYGIPPAVGYDFFQGPIVEVDGDPLPDTLGVTRFSYFINGGNAGTIDPSTGEGIYNFQQGLWGDGTPMTVGGNGYQTGGPVTLFAFPGDPVTDQFWSEENPNNGPGQNAGQDRRHLVTTGPFTLERNVPQDIVFGIVFGQGTSRLNSITVLRANDRLAQTAYNIDFELAPPPPAPPLCVRDDGDGVPEALGSNGPEEGSGACAEAVEVNGEAALVWGYPPTSENYLASFEVPDRLLSGLGLPDTTYNFEGFNIYRYPNANFETSERELIATFDVANGVTTIIDTTFSAELGQEVPFIAARGSDTGVQYFMDLSSFNLVNYTDYFFGITAYSYSPFSIPKVIESKATELTVRPADLRAGNGGSIQQADLGDVVGATLTSGGGRGTFTARVVDPSQIRGNQYQVQFFTHEETGTLMYRILRDGVVIFDAAEVYASTGVLITVVEEGQTVRSSQPIIVDGLEFFTASQTTPEADEDEEPDFAGDGTGIVETAYPNVGDVCANAASDPGCQNYDGNTVWHDPAGGAVPDYYLTAFDGTAAEAGQLARIKPFIGAAVPDDFEIRFTEAGGLAVYVFASAGNTRIARVPFEIWNVGISAGTEDDVRMIPALLLPSGQSYLTDWTNQFPGTDPWVDGPRSRITQPIYAFMPDRPDGYARFEQDATELFGGPGGVYNPNNDRDTQIDTNPQTGQACVNQRYYVNFCYKGAGTRVYTFGRLSFADLAGDGTTPPAGTVVRLITVPKPEVVAGDVFTIDASTLRFITGDQATAEEALDAIGVVPNPYLGTSDYETGNLDRIVRFTNLPDEVTIRIFTVSGTLVKTLNKSGPERSLDWNLETENNLPVASGMYLIHVDVPGVGERVLKFGVINRRTRITIF